MLDLEILIFKARSIDGLASSTIKPFKISALQHELRDDPMEDGVPVGEALSVLPGGETVEVGSSARDHLIKQLQGDVTIVLTTSCHSEENLGSLRRLLLLSWSLLLLRYRSSRLLELLLLLPLLLLLSLLLCILLAGEESSDLIICESLLSQLPDKFILALTKSWCRHQGEGEQQ